MKRYLAPAVVLAFAANLAVALAAPPGTSLDIKASPNPVVYGHTVTLSGKLTGKNKAGKTIQVQADPFPYDGNFDNVATAVTATNGQWSAKNKPLENTRYRARQGSTTSGFVTELVRIRVSLKLSDRTPAAGHRVRFYGRACPQHDGALVKIQRRTRTGHWRTKRRTHLRDIPGSTCSKYSKRIRIFHDGRYRAFVVSPDADHANGRSRSRFINAHN
jgi:hypothetical protein